VAPVDVESFSTATLLSMVVNVISIVAALGLLGVWLRKRVKLAFNNATNQLKTQLADADKAIKEQVDDLASLLQSLTDETRRAHERLDRHLETHGYVSPSDIVK
jgi:F0F1-type ATP synthase membrane subunit b/b'